MALINKGFKAGEKIECILFGRKHLLEVSSNNTEDGLPLTEEEIAEVNWLITSNILDRKEIQKKVLAQINEIYEQWEDEHKEHNDLSKEVEITTIMIDISKDDSGDTGDISKIVAFCGESGCDEEHGISISFKNREFMNVSDFATFNYDPNPAFDYNKWQEENPLMGMVPKFANILIKNGFTDKRNICSFKNMFLGDYNESVKNDLKNWILSTNQKHFERCAFSIKDKNLILIKIPKGKELKDCINETITISREDIIDCFIYKKDYVINEHQTNHFLTLHFVLKDNKILIFEGRDGNAIINFLANEFYGTKAEITSFEPEYYKEKPVKTYVTKDEKEENKTNKKTNIIVFWVSFVLAFITVFLIFLL